LIDLGEKLVSTYCGLKTIEGRLSNLRESLEVRNHAHTGERDNESEFHRRTSLELIL
jgi:hypothetical protein